MSKLDKISSSYHSNLATSLSINENFSEFNMIDSPNMDNSQIIQGKEEHEHESEIAINYDVEGEDENSQYPQFVTYVDHPVIKNKLNIEYESPSSSSKSKKNNQNASDINVHFDGIVNFYFASMGVIGLFILFRAMQKSKY